MPARPAGTGLLSPRRHAGPATRQPEPGRAPAGLPVRRLAALCARRPPTLAAAAAVRLSASTVRTMTEAVGARREAEVAAEIARAWQHGLPPVAGPPPERLYVAMDGIAHSGHGWGGARGQGREGGAGAAHAPGRAAAAASYAAGLEPAAAFGQRARVGGAPARAGRCRAGRRAGGWGGLDLDPGRRALPPCRPDRRLVPRQRADLGPGPRPLGRGTAETTTWVETQLARLAQGQAASWPSSGRR